MSYNDEKIFSVRNLNKQFGPGCPACRDNKELEGNYCRECGTVHALQDVNLDLHSQEVLGIVGESGSGKSTLMKCLYFNQEPSGGEAWLTAFEGGETDIFSVSNQKKRHIQNTLMGMVYQNPMLGLRMNFSALANIGEKLIAAGQRHFGGMKDRATALLEHVNIPLYRMREEPANFSGGMQQRVQIAKALSNNPPILLLDEVTTGLDLSVQAKVLDLIAQIRQELDISIILVSHDLGVIRMLADRTMVMLQGRIVESGLTDQILEDPRHPYTQELVQSLL